MRSHDDLCESVEVDIGVGSMHSPCGCEDRAKDRELEALRARAKELQKKLDAVSCPFCGENDFDLIGLKSHLQKDCEAYQAVVTLPRIFHEATDQD